VPFVSLAGRQIEYVRVGGANGGAPTVIFLHEGLGSIGQWKDFPAALCDRLECGGIVYNRFGYGASDPPARFDPLRFMHDEALTVLPGVLDALEVNRPILVGHSDGGSIAVIYAGAQAGPVDGLVLEAPHVFVEDVTLQSIRRIRAEYDAGPSLRQRLGRYHADVDRMFHSWTDAWLAPAFDRWNIEASVDTIRCPTLLVQGRDDPYGTVRQVEAIERRAKGRFESALVAECGHAPHLEQPEIVLDIIGSFVAEFSSPRRTSP
jgi:pimeloyl-ACP methyl ester carboxylesterase